MACGFSVGQRRCRRMPTSTSVAPVARPARTPGTCCLPRPFFSSSPNSGSAPAGSSGAPEVALQSPPLPPGSPPPAVSVTCPPREPAEQVGPGAVTALHSHRPVDPHATRVCPGLSSVSLVWADPGRKCGSRSGCVVYTGYLSSQRCIPFVCKM